MKLRKWFVLLLALSLLCSLNFAGTAWAADEEDPCISNGTCIDTGIGDPDDIYNDGEGLVIYADGISEKVVLSDSIDSEDVGADLTAVNGGSIDLSIDKESIVPGGDSPADEDSMLEIYGSEIGVNITTEDSGGSVKVTSNSIGSDMTGLMVTAGSGTSVVVKNDTNISGTTAVDALNTGGTVELQTGYVEGSVGVSVLTNDGKTTVTTDDILSNGYGVVVEVSDIEGLESGSASVNVTVKGNITDDSSLEPEEAGFEPDPENAGAKDPAVVGPYSEDFWKDGYVEWTDEDPEWDEIDSDWAGPDEWISWKTDQTGALEDEEAAYDEVINSTGVVVNADTADAEVEMNVTGMISAAYGNEINAENGSSVTVSVKGNVETDFGSRIAAWDDSTASYSFGSDVIAGGRAVDTYNGSGTLTVDIKGNVIAEDSESGEGDDIYEETIGIYTNSEGSGDTNISVGKGIKVKSESADYTAFGIASANIGGNIDIDVKKNVTVSGIEAVGISILNDPEGGAFGEDEEELENDIASASGAKSADLPPVTTVTIHGNVAAKASKDGSGAVVWNDNGKTTVTILGDLKGSENGLEVNAFGKGPDSFADILVTGTISGDKAGVVVNDEADNDGNKNDNLSLTVWKIDPGSSGKAAQNNDGQENVKVEKNIKYIVRIAEGQEEKIQAVDEDGNELQKYRSEEPYSYYYAKQDQKIYVVSVDGEPLPGAYNGTTPLRKDESGRYFLIVPMGGGILLSSKSAPGPQPPVPPEEPVQGIDFYFIDDLSWLFNRQLPRTGFSASVMTELQALPQELSYGTTGWTIQIPELGVAESIMTVPNVDGDYPVEWLGSSVGLLEESSLPGKGVAVLTGHNHLNSTEAGPFISLGSLEEGARMMVTDARNKMQTYQVYGNYKIVSDGFASIVDQVRENALVLITCEDESVDGGYLNRRVILAEPL